MWIVAGKTLSGKEVSYKIPTAKDTDKGHVVGLAYAAHSKGAPTDPLDHPTLTTTWTADNVQTIPTFNIGTRSNFSVEKRVAKGVWERHSVRALRTLESASEALEGAASADPEGKYRVRETLTQERVVAISKNAKGAVAEVPDPPKEEIETEGSEGEPAPKPAPKPIETEGSKDEPAPKPAPKPTKA